MVAVTQGISQKHGGVVPAHFEGHEVDVLRQHSQSWPACLLVHLCEVFLICTDVGLSVGDLEDLDLLHGPLYVFLSDTGATAHVAEGEGFVLVVADEVDDARRPPGEVGLLAEV